VLRRDGIETRVLDAYAEELTEEAFVRRVNEYGPDVIGVTSTTPFFYMAARTCQLIKANWPRIPIILGGPHVTVMKKAALLLDSVDFGVIGEGETTLPALLMGIRDDGRGLDAIPNLLFRRDGEVVMTDLADCRIDLDSLPLPDRSDLPLKRYFDSLSLHHRAMSMMTSRGCPYRCCFARRTCGAATIANDQSIWSSRRCGTSSRSWGTGRSSFTMTLSQ
jgi:radical SAM superfamily enzyme YgiQ (UPF0313 family)